MALDDLPLERPAEPASPFAPPPDPPRSPLRWVVAGVAGLAIGAVLLFLWMSRTPATPAAPPAATAPEVSASPSSRPARQPMDLPPLDASDTFIRDLVSALSKNPSLARLVATPGIVRATALGVMQIGDGRTPVDWLRVLRPATRLQIDGRDAGAVTAASYERWDAIAEAIASVSPADAAQLYVNVKPLIDEAYVGLGQPDGDFDRAIARAIAVLEATPDPTASPTLLRRPGYFEHEDPALQALRPVQKQLLLLGPTARHRLLAWLDEFSRALGL